MTDRFSEAAQRVLAHEGVLSDDPADPGGLTKYGISQRAYPGLDIARLTRADALAIYRRDYWTRCRCDALPAGIALALFDAAVQHGPERAVRLLQRVLGVAEDGRVGAATLAAATAAAPAHLLAAFMAERALLYAGLPGWPRFGRGWARRAFAIMADAVAADTVAADAGAGR